MTRRSRWRPAWRCSHCRPAPSAPPRLAPPDHHRPRRDRRWPAGINVGVACRASNVVGLDLDRKDGVDGVDTLRALCAAARWPWPATLTVATAHNGLHLYFRAPAGVIVPSTIGRWPGVDVRAPAAASAATSWTRLRRRRPPVHGHPDLPSRSYRPG
ncbi:bifunctional DNA primase/polymerase [Micromonospora aurantiaca (nom. illeg.)]|uniref:bifunctional DNA primase/polymerase n=1 Tax=Micromonospora aurantiaca (nom. illeg.) TaxID=47850 RepID=UPI000B8282A4|nr:bifunctional DNA primase/polymerase [Micromonospora aurantiaca]